MGKRTNRRGGRMREERRGDGSMISQPADLPPPCFHGDGTGGGSVLWNVISPSPSVLCLINHTHTNTHTHTPCLIHIRTCSVSEICVWTCNSWLCKFTGYKTRGKHDLHLKIHYCYHRKPQTESAWNISIASL